MSRRPVGVVASLLCCLVAACSAAASPPAAPPAPAATAVSAGRSPDELLAAVAKFHLALADGALPTVDGPGFLEPPVDAELAWIGDRAVPMAVRLEQAMALLDPCKAILRAYSEVDLELARTDLANARDSAASLRWSEAVIRLFGWIAPVLVDELLPTILPSDPSYQHRLDGRATMAVGMFGLLQGSLITLHARRSDLADRQRLAGTWSDHIARYARQWDDAQCTQLTQWVTEVAAAETDPAITDSLRAVRLGLQGCLP